MKFAWIPPGTFLMGSPPTEEGREPYEGADETQHRVTLTKGFYLGVHQVTRGQFARFVKATGHKTEAETGGGAHYWNGKKWELNWAKNWRTPGFEQAEDHPVVCISWNDAVAFCAWLTRQDGQGRRYRLPTETEWECACRAGTTTAYPWGDRIEDGEGWCNIADQTAKKQFARWTEVAPWEDGYVYTSPVGAFRPNNWGLYDMIGNVWEWCADWYGPYPCGDIKRSKILGKPEYRVLRGGSWYDYARGCRAAFRFRIVPPYRNDDCGCRVVLCMD
jgi:formylglycine-generating enzyme required for sulfatase activity